VRAPLARRAGRRSRRDRGGARHPSRSRRDPGSDRDGGQRSARDAGPHRDSRTRLPDWRTRRARVGPSHVEVIMNWTTHQGYEDIRYETSDGIAKITICRPEVHNAFRPQTVTEMIRAFDHIRDDASTGVVILTGQGDKAFCSGGDQRVRGKGGYVGADGVPRLNVLDLQKLIRSLPKPVVAMVAGYAVGGGHVLHLVCDLTISADNGI